MVSLTVSLKAVYQIEKKFPDAGDKRMTMEKAINPITIYLKSDLIFCFCGLLVS